MENHALLLTDSENDLYKIHIDETENISRSDDDLKILFSKFDRGL